MTKLESTPMVSSGSLVESLGAELKQTANGSIEDRWPAAIAGIDWLWQNFPRAIHTFHYVKRVNTGDKHSPVRAYTDKEAALKDAFAWNTKGYDVFFMVSEGDGVIHEPHKTCRSQASVVKLVSCFIDTDKCPKQVVDSYIATLGITPSFTVESSPGRFHIYFRFAAEDKSEQTIARWQAVQHMMHRLGDASIVNPSKELGTDGTMSDFAKVLRVPGFVHVSKRFTARVLPDAPNTIYSLDVLHTVTKASTWVEHVALRATGAVSTVPDLNSTERIESGERFQSLQSLSLSLANQGGSEDNQFKIFEKFCIERLDNEDGTYVHGKDLTPKAMALWDSAWKKVQREDRIENEVLQKALADLDTPKVSEWLLPDEFYLSAPNGFGDVIAQVMKYSLYPYASLAFGTFITGLSILKARTHLTPHGSSPALYTLNVAIAGLGKGDPMTLLQNLFVSKGMGKLISNEIRSDRGLYNHLAANNGMGLCILDEVAPLLRAIQREDANSHHANISKALLQLYSAGAMKGISFGKIASSSKKTGEPEIVIDNPMLAFLGYTVPKEFNSLFSSDSVAKGLFQRFIPIITESIDIPQSEHADKTAIIQSDLFNVVFEASEIDEDGNAIEPIQTVARTRMPFTPSAKKKFDDLQNYYRAKLISTANNPDEADSSGLYSRIAEQIERVATVLALDEIDDKTLDYAVKFMQSRHKAMLSVASTTVLQNVGSASLQNETLIISTVAKMCRDQGECVVYKSELYKRLRTKFYSLREFDTAVFEAAELGKVEMVPRHKPDKKGSRVGIGIKLLNIL